MRLYLFTHYQEHAGTLCAGNCTYVGKTHFSCIILDVAVLFLYHGEALSDDAKLLKKMFTIFDLQSPNLGEERGLGRLNNITRKVIKEVATVFLAQSLKYHEAHLSWKEYAHYESAKTWKQIFWYNLTSLWRMSFVILCKYMQKLDPLQTCLHFRQYGQTSSEPLSGGELQTFKVCIDFQFHLRSVISTHNIIKYQLRMLLLQNTVTLTLQSIFVRCTVKQQDNLQ